ncbi:class I SAM-dependent methyltransferase [Candidatus Micrarchaeota archaeon]|nr:class I SAM-dependent methyltransferase [Candidatus Micrarchaeota archaeon]
MESPDIPWAKRHDDRPAPKEFSEPPDQAAVFFHEFLKLKNLTSGKLADVGCGNGRNAIYFAKEGYEVHAIDHNSSLVKDLDMYGVNAYSFSLFDYWFFEDGFFDFIIDSGCHSNEIVLTKKEIYVSEVKRVLKKGGFYLLASTSYPIEIEKGFENDFIESGFEIVEKTKTKIKNEQKTIFIMRSKV